MAFKRKSEQPEVLALDDKFKVYCSMDPVSAAVRAELLPLSQINRWLKQAQVLDMKNVTETDTGLCFFKFRKRAIDYNQFLQFLRDISNEKKLDLDMLKLQLQSSAKPRKQEKN